MKIYAIINMLGSFPPSLGQCALPSLLGWRRSRVVIQSIALIEAPAARSPARSLAPLFPLRLPPRCTRNGASDRGAHNLGLICLPRQINGGVGPGYPDDGGVGD